MLKDKLIEANAVRFGNFELTSGIKTNYYIDMKRAMTRPDILEETVNELAKHVTAQAIAGVELGAIPLLVGLSLKLKIPHLIVRKVAPGHGTQDMFIGDIKKDGIFDIIEDVVTTGNSVLKAAELLKRNGAKVSKVICVVDREEGGRQLLSSNHIMFTSIFRASELIGTDK